MEILSPKLVSIVTRTKNRPIFLSRALKSISHQTFRNFEWIVVNDGGEKNAVETIVDAAKKMKIATHVTHHDTSLGMEAASNSGISRATGAYLCIHDDDDSWDPRFLETCVNHLTANPTRKGVVTRTTVVEELIIDDHIKIIKKYPYDIELSAISLFQIAHLNKNFPPISFIFCRKVLDEIGPFRSDLPVLGDWEFNLRFLLKYDIEVIPEALANYHIRPKIKTDITYANSVIGGNFKHKYYYTYLLNYFLRKDISEGKIGLGFLINICNEFEQVNKKINRSSFLVIVKNLLKKIGIYKKYI